MTGLARGVRLIIGLACRVLPIIGLAAATAGSVAPLHAQQPGGGGVGGSDSAASRAPAGEEAERQAARDAKQARRDPPAAGREAPQDRNTVGATGPSTLVYPPWNHTYGIHRARTQHLKVFLGGRTVFSDPQGLAAVKLERDDDPKMRVDDFQLTALGLNAGRGEIIFNSSMQTLAMYGTDGAGEGQFHAPRGIAADVNGNIYVADTGNRRVVNLVWRDRQLAWKGVMPGPWQEPWGVAVAPPGLEVYVSDRAGNQVYRWIPEDPTGARAGGAGSEAGKGGLVPVFPEGIDRPTGVAVSDRREAWLSAKEDALYVIHEDGARLGKFDRQGRPIASTAAALRDSIRAAPRFAYLAVDFYGNVWVTDTGNGTIYKFKRDLTYLTRYGEPGEGDHKLVEPRGIAIWKRFGQVLVAEREGAQYFFVGTDVLLPEGRLPIRVEGEGMEKTYAFEALFTDPTDLSLEFLSPEGALLDSLTLAEPVDTGRQTVTLHAYDLALDLERRGARIVLEPRPTYSSRKRFHRRLERAIEWQSGQTRDSPAALAR